MASRPVRDEANGVSSEHCLKNYGLDLQPHEN